MFSPKEEIRKAFDRGTQAYDWTMEQGNDIWPVMMKLIIWLTIGIFIDFLLSWWLGGFGFGKLNLLAVFFLIPLLIGIMFWPKIIVPIIAAAVASGVAQNPETIKGELIAFFESYIEGCKLVIFGFLLLAIFLAYFPISESPGGFFGLLALIPAVLLSAHFWGFKATWGKSLIYWSLIGMIGLTLAGFMPDAVYTKILGTTPSAMFGVTTDEEALMTYDRKVEEKAIETRTKKIKAYTERIRGGEKLSTEEEKDLKETRGEIERRSLPAISRKSLDKTGDAIENSASWWSKIFGKSGEKRRSDDSDGSSGPRLVDTVTTTQTEFPTSLRKFLPSGRYVLNFDPPEASSNTEFLVRNSNGDNTYINVVNNSIIIQRGEYGCGIFTKKVPGNVQIFAN